MFIIYPDWASQIKPHTVALLLNICRNVRGDRYIYLSLLSIALCVLADDRIRGVRMYSYFFFPKDVLCYSCFYF